MNSSFHTASNPSRSENVARVTYLWTTLVLIVGLGSAKLSAQSAREASRLFQEGRYDDALEIYRALSIEDPEDHRLSYNAGVAAYKAGQMNEALGHFDVASLASDLALQQRAHYNMGNAHFRTGEAAQDFESKSDSWKQAIQSYQHAVTINQDDTSAQENLDFVKRQLEQLEQQQEQEQQQDQNDDSEQDDEQDQQEQQDQQNQDSDSEGDQNEQNQQDQQEQQEENEQQQDQNSEQNQEEEQENQQSQQPSESEEDSKQPDSGEQEDGQQAPPPPTGKMTPEQARQLLDAERDQAKAMIFQPPQDRRSRNRSFKDW